MYRISNDVVEKQRSEYRKNYPPFRPFRLTDKEKGVLIDKYEVLLKAQNGQDFDDCHDVTDESDVVSRYLGKEPIGSDVLLLGVGAGREMLVARDLGFNPWGLTLGTRNIGFATEVLGIDERFILESSFEVLPFSNETFDVVAGFQVFEHATAPLLFLLEQNRVLREGGKLVLEWPPAHIHSMGKNPHHQVCYIPGQAKALLEKAGFDKIKLVYENMQEIPEEEYWGCFSEMHMCIFGTKSKNAPDHVKEFNKINKLDYTRINHVSKSSEVFFKL